MYIFARLNPSWGMLFGQSRGKFETYISNIRKYLSPFHDSESHLKLNHDLISFTYSFVIQRTLCYSSYFKDRLQHVATIFLDFPIYPRDLCRILWAPLRFRRGSMTGTAEIIIMYPCWRDRSSIINWENDSHLENTVWAPSYFRWIESRDT